MKKTIVKTVTKEEIEVIDILCNKCGESCDNSGTGHSFYEGLIEETIDFGYGSNHFGDGTSVTFSICESCLKEYFSTFKIKPHRTDID